MISTIMIEETPPKRSFGIMRLFTSKPGAEKASAMKDPSHAMNRWGAIFGVFESSYFQNHRYLAGFLFLHLRKS